MTKTNRPRSKLLAICSAITVFALIAVLGLSIFTGNSLDTGVYTTKASAVEPADINNDNSVNIFDLSILLSKWSTADMASDLNDDNIVNVFDLSILLSKWGTVVSTNCTNDLSCWPNATNTGYQNAPGYPGTKGIADPAMLTLGSANSTACPLKFESHHTYSFCRYSGGIDIGSPQYPGDPDVGQHLTDVHFIGFLLEDSNPVNDSPMIKMYCASNCTLDYFTIKPANLSSPDIPAPKHGVSYAKSYGSIMGAGWGAYYTYARGFSLKHSDIWGYQSGIVLGGENTAATPNIIEDNWMHDQGQCIEHPGCLTHADGIGMVDTGGTAKYITINHNNMPFIQDNTNDIAFQEGTYDHLTITNNILSGDGYTVAIWDTSTNITFTGNVWTNYAQQFYGVNYGKNFWDTPGSVWAHNKFMWDPAGANPFYEGGPGAGNWGPITASDSGKCWVPSGLSTTDYGGGSC